MLIHAHNALTHGRELYAATKGLFFLGTPFRNNDGPFTIGTTIRIEQMLFQDEFRYRNDMHSFIAGDQPLSSLVKDYQALAFESDTKSPQTVCFYEQEATDFSSLDGEWSEVSAPFSVKVFFPADTFHVRCIIVLPLASTSRSCILWLPLLM